MAYFNDVKIFFVTVFQIEEQLETFMEAFDIVLIDDQTFKFVDALIDLILSGNIHKK